MKVTQKYVASKSGSNFASVKEAFDQLCSDILAQDTNEYFNDFLNKNSSNVIAVELDSNPPHHNSVNGCTTTFI